MIKLIAIKDNAVQAFMPLTGVRAKGEAIRSFIDTVNDPNNKQVYQHPEDYDLYYLGEYDDQTGDIKPCTPELWLRGVEAKKQ